MRITSILLSLFVLLSACTQRAAERCGEAWTPHALPQSFPTGSGVNIHYTDPEPGELKMIADGGFRWVRMDFQWSLTERERGRYDFSPYERLLTALDEHRIRALFILDYGNPLYTADKAVRTEQARKAFARWAVAAAKHFVGRGILWELFNEPNVPIFWPPKPNVNEYIAFAETVSRAWRAEVPNEKLIGPATSLEFEFLEPVFKAGLLEYWSAVSVHPYRQTNPEIVADEYCLLRETIARYRTASTSREIPIISGEWGYSSVWRGMNEQIQGELLARQFLTNVANGIPLSIWYDWRDDGPDPREPEHHFGLVRRRHFPARTPIYDPKPAYHAARTLNTFLNGYTFERRISVGSDGDYVLLFRSGGDYRIAAWTSSPVTHRVTLPGMTGPFMANTFIGEVTRDPISNTQGLTLEISSAPIYLTPRR
ncbi:MAG: cellulase family glycosylhydrolase [Pyrinomonadaceae bacterium]